MFNIFKRKSNFDVISDHFKDEVRVKEQCEATIHQALFARYMAITRMDALAQWAKMTDAEKLEACNTEPAQIQKPVAQVAVKKSMTEQQSDLKNAARLDFGPGIECKLTS